MYRKSRGYLLTTTSVTTLYCSQRLLTTFTCWPERPLFPLLTRNCKLNFTKYGVGQRNGSSTDTEKCKVLYISNNNLCHQYGMNGAKLEKVDEEKDLGVIIDNELMLHRHTAEAVKKANMKLGMIR